MARHKTLDERLEARMKKRRTEEELKRELVKRWTRANEPPELKPEPQHTGLNFSEDLMTEELTNKLKMGKE